MRSNRIAVNHFFTLYFNFSYLLCLSLPFHLPFDFAYPPQLGNPEFIDYDTAQKMTYTIAFFYEVCRLYPPVPVDQKVAVVEETLPSGLKVKPGDLVAWSIIVMNRNPTYWEKPLEIRPERWMNSEGDIKEFDTSLYPSFNGMPRLCLGKPMAQFEAVTVIGGLLQKYKFKLANVCILSAHILAFFGLNAFVALFITSFFFCLSVAFLFSHIRILLFS